MGCVYLRGKCLQLQHLNSQIRQLLKEQDLICLFETKGKIDMKRKTVGKLEKWYRSVEEGQCLWGASEGSAVCADVQPVPA